MDKKNETVNDEIDLLELAAFLLRRWKLLALAIVIGVGLSLVLYHFTVVPTYKANTEIYITNSGTVVSFQDVQLSAELTIDYKEILLSRKVMKKVINDQKLDIDYKTLQNMISISNPKDSHCIIITVTADTPEAAVNIANSIVAYGIDQIYRIVGKDEPTVIDPAELDAVETVKPTVKKYGAIGALIGLVITAGLFTIQYLLDTTLKIEEDIEKYMGLTVLAVVPENSTYKTKNGGKKKKHRER